METDLTQSNFPDSEGIEAASAGSSNNESEGKDTSDSSHEEEKSESATPGDMSYSADVSEISSSDGRTCKMNSLKSDGIDEEPGRQESSEIDYQNLGLFVEVCKSDVKGSGSSSGMAGDAKGNINFAVEVDEDEHDDCEAFSEFVDTIALFNEVKIDSTMVPDAEVTEEMLMHHLKRRQHKHLKISLRNGLWDVKHKIRRALWFNLCHHLHKADESDIFSEFAEDLFTQGDLSDIRIPSFVDMEHLNSYHLNQEGIGAARKILCVLEHSCPDIIYSPLLFSILCLFLHYMDTSHCYNCLYTLLRNKDGGFLPTTKVSYEASKLVIRDLAKKYAKSGYVHLVRNSSNIDQVFDSWIWWIFEDLPFSYLVRIIDCYLHEGVKIFFRAALAILILFAKSNTKKSPTPKKDSSTGNVLMSLRQFCREMPVKVDKLLKTGFGIRGFNRKEIRKLQVKHEMYINSTKHINSYNDTQSGGRLSISRSFSGPIVLQNLGTDTLTVDMPLHEDRSRSRSVGALQPYIQKSSILDRKSLYAMLKWIPTRYAICQPELLYTSEEHGTSLVTLYQRVENYQPTILVIKTTQDEVFGAYCSSYWRERRQKSQLLSYFGTGETFLFTLRPEKRKYDWVGLTQENIPNTASMFQAGDRSILTVGGGHGEAISLDENLLHCRSEKCDTFNNEPLSHTEDFQCKVVEVYGFV